MGDLQFDRAETPAAVACAACKRGIADLYYESGGATFCVPCRDATVAAQESGSGPARFFKALLFGLVGAAIGSGIWYAILALTGMQIGLIAIVVGLIVGGAVRAGSENRGGWPYQLLAMVLTYSAIVTTYMPFMLKGVNAPLNALTLIVVFVVAFAAPFLAGVKNIIGLLIIAFALYEAWKINRRVHVAFTGPFRIVGAS